MTWIRRAWDRPWPWMALVALLFCAPLFSGLTHRDFENDEAIYSFAVDAMVKSGDWLTPKNILEEPPVFLEKPPLKFWIVGLPIRAGLLPADEFGMRFWDALMGSVAFLYIFAIGRRLAGPLCGLAAVLLLFGHTPLVMEHGLRTNNMEAAVFLAYAAGMYHFLAWRSSGPDNRSHIIAIALYFVLAFMTKFVAALFLPTVLLLAALLTPSDRLRLKLSWKSFVLASLIVVVLVAPWFVYEYVTRGSELLDTMFGAHVFKRFTAYLDPAHLHPWHFYLTEIWRQLQISNSLLLVAAGAILILIRIIRRRWVEGALLVLWFALPVALISSGTSKLYHYAYPFLPPVALAGGYAAATIAEWAWHRLQWPIRVTLQARDRAWPAWLRSSGARILLTAVGVAGIAAAIATGFLGRLRIAIGDIVLFRNSGVIRSAIAGVAALGAGGSLFSIGLVVRVLLLLCVLPLAGYRHTLDALEVVDHPYQDARACLTPIVQQQIDRGRRAPGVWVEGRALAHPNFYYLRGLGPWQLRDVASDATVAMHLFIPSTYRPVLLAPERYREFMARLTADSDGLLNAAARKAEVDPSAAVEGFRASQIGYLSLLGSTLILPGPYASCGQRGAPPVVP